MIKFMVYRTRRKNEGKSRWMIKINHYSTCYRTEWAFASVKHFVLMPVCYHLFATPYNLQAKRKTSSFFSFDRIAVVIWMFEFLRENCPGSWFRDQQNKILSSSYDDSSATNLISSSITLSDLPLEAFKNERDGLQWAFVFTKKVRCHNHGGHAK